MNGTEKPITDYEVVRVMGKFGGSFAQAIATAFDRADADHYARLKGAFPELWQEYTDMAQLVRARSEEAGR